MTNEKLFREVKRIIESKEIPLDVSNSLLLAALIMEARKEVVVSQLPNNRLKIVTR